MCSTYQKRLASASAATTMPASKTATGASLGAAAGSISYMALKTPASSSAVSSTASVAEQPALVKSMSMTELNASPSLPLYSVAALRGFLKLPGFENVALADEKINGFTRLRFGPIYANQSESSIIYNSLFRH